MRRYAHMHYEGLCIVCKNMDGKNVHVTNVEHIGLEVRFIHKSCFNKLTTKYTHKGRIKKV